MAKGVAAQHQTFHSTQLTKQVWHAQDTKYMATEFKPSGVDPGVLRVYPQSVGHRFQAQSS